MNPVFPLSILFVLLSLILAAMPWLLLKAIPFGVRIPFEFSENPYLKTERNKYFLRMIIMEALLAIALIFLNFLKAFPFCLAALIIGGNVLFLISRKQITKYKTDFGWYEGKRQVVAASALPRPIHPSRVYWVFLSLAGIPMLITAFLAIFRYDALPMTTNYDLPFNFGLWIPKNTAFSILIPTILHLPSCSFAVDLPG